MKNYIKYHPWEIIEEGFNTELNRVSESLFSIGNGKFGHRGNFEETYTGDSLGGNYVAGVYYPSLRPCNDFSLLEIFHSSSMYRP